MLVISNEPHLKEPRGTYKIAEYDPINNVITVWWKKHSHFRELTSTILHEYQHYLQFWPWYSRYASIHKYSKHPYEIQAREAEQDTPIFLKFTTDRNWKKLFKNEIRLIRLYEKASCLISY